MSGTDVIRPGMAGPRWRSAARELMLIAAAALLYTLVRGLTDDRVTVAFANAERVISFESGLGLFVEPDLQRLVLGSEAAVHVANAVYVAYWPVIAAGLAWLLLRRPAHYPFYRNALLASGALSLAAFALFPLAPPRFLPQYGFVDTIAVHSDSYREFNASALVNEYAAMPSLHFGWVLLVGIAVATLGRSRAARAAGVVAPVLMFAAIVLTANHYTVDGVVAGVIILLGLATATAMTRVRTSIAPPAASAPVPSPASPLSTRRPVPD